MSLLDNDNVIGETIDSYLHVVTYPQVLQSSFQDSPTFLVFPFASLQVASSSLMIGKLTSEVSVLRFFSVVTG